MTDDEASDGRQRTPNDRLRAAREARGWSRSKLARNVNGWLANRGEQGALGQGLVGRWEAGDVAWPRDSYRAALRSLLRAPTDGALGFYRGERPGGVLVVDVDRRQMLMGSAALAVMPAGVASAAGGALAPPPVPSRVGAAEIGQVRTSASAVSSLSFAHGGDFAVRAGVGQLHWACGLLSARCPERLRPQLYAAVSRLADACAFAAFDALDLDRAGRLFELAVACAVEAGDDDLLASALGDMALVSIWVDDPQDALDRTDRGLSADRLSPTARALLHNTAAHAHGHMGDRQATFRSIGEADQVFADAEPGAGWLTYYEDAEHAGLGAHALYALALSGGDGASGESVALHEHAISRYGDAYARSRLGAELRVAVLLMLGGEPDEAAARGRAALDRMATVRSARHGTEVRALHRVSAAHAGRPAVDELRGRSADLLLA